jgi:hypothetical protein
MHGKGKLTQTSKITVEQKAVCKKVIDKAW